VKFFLLILLVINFLYGDRTLKIASYNVENLFDLNKDGYEYKEYIPYTKSNWNKTTYKIKLQNIAKVIKGIDADIIALQEIESIQALKDLRFMLKQRGVYYQYYKIANRKNTTIKVAVLSKIPFKSKEVFVTSSYKYRNILELKFKIDSNEFYLFVNHWKAKSGSESKRIISAKALRKRVDEIGYDKNIILVGDFNSDYEEYKKFKRKRKLNDTNGKTGINHLLRTLKQTQRASKTKYKYKNFYNLWYDTDIKNRYTYIFKGTKEALDNIIISQSLLDSKGMSYKHSSIHQFAPSYLFKKRYIYRWQTTRKKPYKHKGKGYSDHLAVVAEFIYK
jgi:endonuclease/exonuclease/phosphatase family metal-dependent hydrolase